MIEVSEKDFKILSHWASTERTFKNVLNLLEDIVPEDDHVSDRLDIAIDELEMLRHPLQRVAETCKMMAINKAWGEQSGESN